MLPLQLEGTRFLLQSGYLCLQLCQTLLVVVAQVDGGEHVVEGGAWACFQTDQLGD